MHKIGLAVVIAVALSGCVSKYQSLAYEAPPAKIAHKSSFYVMQPSNDNYTAKKYPLSGPATAHAIAAALAPYAGNVTQASSVENLDSAIATARQEKIQYVFQSFILNWEDHATEWTGIPDKISLKLVVYDSQTGQEIASEVSKASSKWATLGGDHPQDLLPLPTQKFVAALF